MEHGVQYNNKKKTTVVNFTFYLICIELPGLCTLAPPGGSRIETSPQTSALNQNQDISP